MRRVVCATSLQLDGKGPSVRCHAIEVTTEPGRPVEVDLDAMREALRDAALVRALRCAGLYADAEGARLGYFPGRLDLPETFTIADRPMIGRTAEVVSGELRLRAEVGVDLEYLRALAAQRPQRAVRLDAFAREVPRDGDRSRPVRSPERVQEETVMRDGIGVLFEQEGRAREEGGFR